MERKGTKRLLSLLLAFVLLLTLLPTLPLASAAEQPAERAVTALQEECTLPEATDAFAVGASSSDMILGGGRTVKTVRGFCEITDEGELRLDGEVLASGEISCLNALDDVMYFIRRDADGASIRSLPLNGGQEELVAQLGDRSVKELYVVNGEDFYLLADGDLLVCRPVENGLYPIVTGAEIWSFAPTPYGPIYATGSLFNYDLHAGERVLISGADGYYVDFDLDGGSLVYTREGGTWQLGLAAAFDGSEHPQPFTGYEIVEPEDLFTNLENPDGDFVSETKNIATRGTRAAMRKTLSTGVQNIVKRAYQMTDIQWTPVADITGWGGGLTYKAGTTYTGLPYGQPVYASYVPWSTTLSGFIAAVNNPSSKMYTDQSTYNKVAPYYSVDCSAFVSWAWNLSSRQTTSSIPNFATKVSSSSYTTLEVGDALCNPGSHVVLVTDITYNSGGTITGIEISESTVNKTTNYCCQKTWYGSGYSYALSKINEKYFNGGYSQYRSKTADNATYAHVCEVPLEGDSCSVCGYGSYAATPVAATISVSSSKTTYDAPGGSSSGSVSAGNQTIKASATVSGAAWYQLSNGKWLPASSATFVCYNTSVSIANKSFPSGRLQQGKSFPVVGDVTTVNPMTKITGSIYSGTSTTGTPVLTKSVTLSSVYGYTLKSSAIDNALTFGSLAAGQYTFVLEITERASCAGQSAQTLTYRETSVFTEGASTSGGIVTAHGIDVSKYQGNIDWATVKNNVDFVIIRCGYGSDISSQDDTKWAYNVSECERLGIPYGVYLFSYAKTVDMAHSEAAHVIRLLQGHTPTLPVYYDLEDSNTTGSLTNAQILAIAQAFCTDIAAAGYTPGVYTMTSWWNNKLSDSTYNQWSRWVAQFASSCSYTGNYDMWQYSDSGSVGGISGNVDMDYWYADYPTVGGHTHSLTAVAARAATCTAAGNIAYWYCAGCGKYFSNSGASSELTQAQTVTAALGHSYTTTSIPATCLQYEGVRYSCSRCGDSYETYATAWSNWSTTRPTGVDESKIQSRTEYRYRDYTTKTSYNTSLSGYEQVSSTWERTASGSVDYVASWPGGFQTSNSLYTTYHNSPVTASETETNKTVINSSETVGYIYWHWCRGSYQYGPINRKTSTTQTSEFNTFHAFYSTTAPSNYPSASDNSYNNPNAATCTDTYWYYAIPVTRQTYSSYRKLFTYGKWGSWSSWGTAAYTADSTRQVETRTTYRYVTSGLGSHTWDSGTITTAATCTATGVKTYTCTVCGTKKTETVPANGSHSFVNGVCTQCGLVQGATSLALGGRYVLITQQAKAADESYTATMELSGISTTSTKYGTAADYTGTPNGAYVLVIEQGTTAGTYAFRHGNGSYLTWSSGNSLKTVSSVTENSSWTVSFDGDGNATISNVADSTRRLQFNATDPRFACYTGDQKPVKLLPFNCAHSSTENAVTEATCTEAGSIVTVCADCGEELGQQSTPALGHLWGNWTITTEPTCAAEGVQTRTCARCSATQTEAVPATGQHTYQNGVCTVCHVSAPVFVPADNLQAGDRIIFVYLEDGPVAAGPMSGSGSSTYLTAVPATLEGVRLASDSALIFTVGSGSLAGTWTFENGGRYLSPSTAESGSNYVYLKTETADWSVSFADGTATVQSGSRELRYNSGSPRFSTYVSGQKEIMIYKEAANQAGCAHASTKTVETPATCAAAGSRTVYCLLCGASVSTTALPVLSHNYAYTVTKTPTKTAQGTLQGVCNNCGDTITVTLPKFTADGAYTYSVAQASTCIAEGIGRYTWTETAYGSLHFDVELALGEHSYVDSVTAPTCTAQGYTTHTCSVCGSSYSDAYTAATGHTYNSNGVCTNCGAAAQTYVLASSIAAGDRVIFVYRGDATHDPKAAGMLAGSGSKTYLDAVNVSLSGNTAIYGGLAIFTVEAGANGSFRFKLGDDYLTPSTAESGNNYVYLEGSSADWTVTISDGTATVHSGDRDLKFYYSSTGSRFATYLSGQKDIAIYKLTNCAHSSTTVVTTPATCTEAGLSVTVCASCGAELASSVIPALGHNYQSSVTAASCTAAGYTTHTCSRCGDSYTDTPTAALGHSYGTATTQPTCTAQGYTTHTCSRCGDSYVDSYVDPAGHSFVNGICSVCGAEATTYVLTHSIKDGDQIIFVFPGDDTYTQKASGPIVGSNKYLSAVDVTLSGNTATPTGEQVFTVEAGTGENSFAFVADGKYLTGKDSGTDLTLETEAYYWTVTFDTDNYASAYNGARYIRFYQTSSAAARFNTNSTTTRKIRIYRLGVNPVSCSHTNTTTETIPATCTAAGSQTTICADCGTQIGDATVLPALSHNVTYSVQTAPTASAAGSLSGTCVRCGQTLTVTLPALNANDYSYSVVHAATCTQTGTGRYTWSANGGFSFDVTLPVGNHSYVDTVVAPTCTEQGYTAHVCSVCGDTVTDTYVAATGHNYQNFVCTVCDAVAPNFVRVDSVTDLAANDEIIFVYHSGDVTKAAGKQTGSGTSAYLTAVEAEVLQNAAASGSALVFTVGVGGEAGKFTFSAGGKYLAASESANALSLQDDSTEWTVSFTNGVPSLQNGTRYLKYYSSSPRFNAYASGQKDVQIYKRVNCAHTATTEEIVSAATCTAAGSANVVCTNCGKILAVTSVQALGHNYAAVVTEPTCTAAGYTTYTCSRCNDSYTDDATAALGHDYAAVVTEPTCTAAGCTTHTCSRCGDSYTDNATAALGHNYIDVVTAPTCTAAGYTTHTCSRCGNVITDTPVAATGHNFDETGVCTVCGTTAPNYVRTNSLTAGDQVIFVFGGDDSGHEPRAAGAQTGSGNSAYLTAVDVMLIDNRAITAQAQVFTVGAGSEAGKYTFTAGGNYLTAGESANALSLQAAPAEWTVSFTDGVPGLQNNGRSLYYYSSNPRFSAYTSAYKSVLIYKLGTDVSGCRHENAQTVTVAATCTAAGSTTVTCPDCGTVLSSTEIPALGHNYVYAVTQTPTLTAQGRIRGTCSRCNATTALINIPNLSSSENYTHTVTQQPTCTATGTERYALTGTDYTQYGVVIELTLAMTPHTYVDGVCSVCGASAKNYLLASSISAGDTIIFVYLGDATHDPAAAGSISGSSSTAYMTSVDASLVQNAAVTSSALEFTVEAGETEGTFRFKNGSAYLVPGMTTTGNYGNGVLLKESPNQYAYSFDWTVVFTEGVPEISSSERLLRYNAGSPRFAAYPSNTSMKQIAIYKLVECEHTSSTETIVTPATCTVAGLRRTVCDTCGRVLSELTIPALGHDYSTVITPPTCTASGYTTYTCSRCSDTYTGNETAALGHSYSAAVTAPTCTAAGYTTYTCTRCNDTYTGNETAALGHDWGEWTVTTPATETVAGEETRTCTRCGATETRPVAALEHNYVATVTAPTCTAAGYTTYTCSFCGDSYTADEVPALGHNYVAAVTVPTCTAAGYTTHTCSRCGDSYTDTPTTALGHSWGAWTETQPTASANGSRTRSCTRCGATETETISKEPVVTGYNLTTNGDVSVNSFISVPQYLLTDDPGMYVTVNDGAPVLLSSLSSTPNANGYALTGNGFKFPQTVPAKNMQDTVTLRLYHSNGTQVAFEDADKDGSVTYSVQGYINQVLEDAEAYEAAYPGLPALCKAMSAYGSYAQVQQSYTIETGASHDPVSVDTATANEIEAISTASISGAATPSVTTNSIDGLSFYGASLVMLSKMTLRFYFTYTGSGTLTCGGKSLETKGSYYYVDLTGIAATDFGKGQTVTVTDGTNTCTVSGYSVNRYVYKVLTDGSANANMLNLAKAIAYYGIKAEAYYNNSNS